MLPSDDLRLDDVENLRAVLERGLSIGMAVYPADASLNRLRVTLADVDWVKPPDTPQTRVLFYRTMRRDQVEFPYSAPYAAERGGLVKPPFEVVSGPCSEARYTTG